MLALIAGEGGLPPALFAALRACGAPDPVICQMAGFAPDLPADLPRKTFRLETLGTLLADLRDMGVTDICMAGRVRRPVIDARAIDPATAPLIARLADAMALGDDGTLRAIIMILEEAGFTVRAAHDIAPGLLPRAGVQGRVQPCAQHIGDATRGEAMVAMMGHADSGQACVVRGGEVLATEGPDGTDAMIAALCLPVVQTAYDGDPVTWVFDGVMALIRGDAPAPARGAILFKAPKPDQDRRVDLPTIGARTFMLAAEAGFDAVVIETGGVIVLDQPQCVAIADAMGIAFWVRDRGAA